MFLHCQHKKVYQLVLIWVDDRVLYDGVYYVTGGRGSDDVVHILFHSSFEIIVKFEPDIV